MCGLGHFKRQTDLYCILNYKRVQNRNSDCASICNTTKQNTGESTVVISKPELGLHNKMYQGGKVKVHNVRV